MICGLLGEKLGHSYSPQIHNCLGTYSYNLFEVAPGELEAFLKGDSFHGLNVTIPYKKAAIPFCSELSPQARALGAVNTLVRRADGTLIGHNTDYFGFRSMATRAGISYAGKKVLVLGSGGASNTVCAVMKELGAQVVVISRHGQNNYDNLHIHADCSVIVNATPVGMYPNTGISPVSVDLFPRLEYVMDLIYNPRKTQLLLDAQARGIPTQNGLWMLVAQAAESAQWFTGNPMDPSSIAAIYHKLNEPMRHIILIGMPGCGKSTIGQILASKLNKSSVDSDIEVESASGCSIPEIFQNYGEEEFRMRETAALSKLCKQSSCVIATGGGCVTRKANLPILRQNGIIVWIRRSVSALSTEGRPLSQNGSLERMYQVREPLYRSFADIIVDNDSTPEETASQIMKQLEDIQ